jgi:hypothetical protein
MKNTSTDINLKGATWTLGIVVTVIIACLFFFASRRNDHLIHRAEAPNKVASMDDGAFFQKPWKEKRGDFFGGAFDARG